MSKSVRHSLAAVVGTLLCPALLLAQPIGLTLGDSLRVIVTPGGKLTVPLHLDLSQSPGTALAALQGSVTWAPTRLRLDSARAVAGGPLTLTANTALAAGGLASLAWYGAAGASTSGPIARLHFTGLSAGGGTLVAFAPSAASDAAAASVLDRITSAGHQVCVAGSSWSSVTPRWGDVTNDGVVNVVDAQQLARWVVGLSVPNAPKLLERGDVTADGVVNVTDAQQIARYAASLSAATRINQVKAEAGEVPSVASVTATPTPTTAYIGRTRALVATPRDSVGGSLAGCYQVTWQSLQTGIATVSSSGVVTGRASGTATIRATVSGLTATASVAVAPVPVATVTVTPSPVTVAVGGTQQLAATLRDSIGLVISGQTVTWSSSDVTKATVSTTGLVRALAAGTVTITAASDGKAGTAAVTLDPIATTMAINAGDGQTATVNTAVAVRPAVVVRNVSGQGVPNVTVTFALGTGGGQVTGGTVVTDNAGVAAVGSWRLGTTTGAKTLTATFPGLPTVTFSATAVAGAPASSVLLDASTQVTRVGESVERKPGVRLSDAFGNRVAGATVTFNVASGGGTVSGATQATNAAGEARVGDWVMGVATGSQSLGIAVPGLSPGVVYARAVPASDFPISVRLLPGTSATYLPLFERAAERWRKAIIGAASSVNVSRPANECVTGQPAISEVTSGLIIFAAVAPIDGAGKVLASAGPCLIRGISRVPIVGVMTFDIADLDAQIAGGAALGTATHEIGHILGMGTLWDEWGLRSGVGGTDPYFTGPNAQNAFTLSGRGSYTGQIVPIENQYGTGSRDVHWRESVMGRELMTSLTGLTQTSSPFSTITLGALQDMGYTVTPFGYDDYTVSAALMAGRAMVLEGAREVLHAPRYVVDEGTGRVLSATEVTALRRTRPAPRLVPLPPGAYDMPRAVAPARTPPRE